MLAILRAIGQACLLFCIALGLSILACSRVKLILIERLTFLQKMRSVDMRVTPAARPAMAFSLIIIGTP